MEGLNDYKKETKTGRAFPFLSLLEFVIVSAQKTQSDTGDGFPVAIRLGVPFLCPKSKFRRLGTNLEVS